MKISQFHIWNANLNPRMGTESGKVRPVLIIQTDLLNNQHPSTLVCPITTKVQPEAETLRVYLKKSRTRLKADCDVMIDQVRAIDNRRLIKWLGSVDVDTKTRIKENLRIVLDL